MSKLERDMTAAARDLMGSGYVDQYYRQIAGDFVQVAEAHIRDAVKAAREGIRREAFAEAEAAVSAKLGITSRALPVIRKLAGQGVEA